jgi:ABC-type bacteriocin/lantibiotic exporter with double-glycine peptidase domain
LVFDEATSALDNATEAEVIKAIEFLHGSKTIVIIAHRLSTVAHCDRIYKMHAGKVVSEEIRQDTNSSNIAAPSSK